MKINRMITAVPAPVFGPKEPQALYVTINGANVRLGMKYADVKAALRVQTKDVKIVSCYFYINED